MKLRKIICMMLTATMLSSLGTGTVFAEENEDTEQVSVSEQQSNAINMLNYICELSYEASTSKNRIHLEELYSALTNNTRPNAVDTQTLDEVLSLLDTLEKYRMTDVKRDRVQYIYEQSQAQAFRDAIPNPLGLLSLTRAYSHPKKLLSVIYMTVDSVSNYQSAKADTDMERLMQNWELEDEESKTLNNSRKDLFSYMVNMVTSYGLDDRLSLNEESIADFVKWKNNDSVLRKIQFFESKQNTYQAFGPYWLTLAQCYYENEDYEKCLQALGAYEALNIRIFRKDYELAKSLPMTILAADELLSDEEYTVFADKYGQVILDNTNDAQWDLRYFVAETFVDLYNRTGKKEYLQRAYDIAVNNTNYLLDEQEKMNMSYIAAVEKVKVPDGATKIQEKDIKEYNKYLNEVRKKELPPVSEALLINIDMLYSTGTELELSEDEKKRVDSLLRGSDGTLFMVEPLDSLYSFEEREMEPLEEVYFDEDEIIIPARYATTSTYITVEVNDADKTVFDDWVIDEVEREEETDVNTYRAIFSSETADEYDYVGDEIVTVTIQMMEGSKIEPQIFQFQASREKALGVLDSFDWLDSASKWTDDISFERIDRE